MSKKREDAEDAEGTIRDALSILTREYRSEVNGLAMEIKEELEEKIEDGEKGESLREWLIETIHESVDGHQRVIYTFKAKVGLLVTENADAYVDDFGTEGLVKDGNINWEGMMYAAMERDVIEALDRMGVDVDNPDEIDED
jgi:hypothetical protein